jgi:hypothetical protein
MMLVENQTGTTMRLIGNLTERLNRWIAMYKMALNYEDRERRRPSTVRDLVPYQIGHR